jgi:predicted dehydrogenase
VNRDERRRGRLDVAVVGAGKIARMHLPVLRDTPDVRVAALVDTDPVALGHTADPCGIARRLTSHRPLIEEGRVDAAFVLVSVLQVAAVAADFLEAGIATFLEKPAGLYTHQTRHLGRGQRHPRPGPAALLRR